MNVEDLRAYCLSLSAEVVEKFPFRQFAAARDILAFYVGGHIFCYFDINDISHVTVKCRREDIPALLEEYDCVGPPYNGNARYWVSIDARRADDQLTQRLIAGSFDIVKHRRR